jgi:hypothetical protein
VQVFDEWTQHRAGKISGVAFGTDRLSRGRARVEQRSDGLHVRIPARRNWFVMAFLTFWVVMVVRIAGEAFLGGERVEEDGVVIAVIGGLIFLVAALLATAYVIWSLIGREEVTVGGGRLEHVRRAGPVRNRREFDASRVEDVRHDERRGWFMGTPQMWGWWGWTGGSIAFDYGQRTHHLGIGLDDAEAKHLARQIGDAIG